MNLKILKLAIISALLMISGYNVSAKPVYGKLKINRNNVFVDEREVNLKISFKVILIIINYVF